MSRDWIWSEKYRPRTSAECILPDDIKAVAETTVKNGASQNLIFTGGPGVGKTTLARAILEEIGCDYILINGSMNGNIDTLRNEIQNFASSVSLSGGRKYVILDEADYLNQNSTQPALRGFMEEFSRNCGFILTCNYLEKIIEPLHSRCSVVEFKISKKDASKLAGQFFKRACSILDKEGVKYDKQTVAAIVTKHYPDWRRVLNELQKHSSKGSIGPECLSSVSDATCEELISLVKAKDFSGARKWVVENVDYASSVVFRKLYDSSTNYIKPQYVPALVTLIGRYQYQAAFAVDHEINLMAFIAELMVEGIYE